MLRTSLGVGVLALLVAVAVVTPWVAWSRSGPRVRSAVKEWIDDVVVPVVRPPRTLSVPQLERRIVSRVLSAQTVTVSGRAVLHPTTVAVSPDDFERLLPVRDLVEAEVTAALVAKGRQRTWEVAPGFRVRVEADADTPDGRPSVQRPVPAPPPVDLPPDDASVTARLPWAPGATVPGGTATGTVPVGAQGHSLTVPHVACELIALDGGPDIDLSLSEATVVVGRTGCDVELPDERVSARHAELHRRGGQWVLSDLGSTNGTWVNGQRIAEAGLIHNDVVSFAPNGPRFVFSRLSRDLPVAVPSRRG